MAAFADAAEARLDFSPGISYFFGQLSKAFLSPGSHFSLFSLVSAFCIGFVVLAARRYKKGRRIRLRSSAAGAVSETDRAEPVEPGRPRLFLFQPVLVWHHLRLGGAVLRGAEPRCGRSADGGVRPDAAGAAAGIRLPVDHHAHAVPGLRARLLAQSLSLAPDSVPVGIPQSSSLGDGADAADELPRPPGLHVHLSQHSGDLHWGRERCRRLPAWPARRRNTACPRPTSSWCFSSTFTSTCSTRSCGSRSPAGSAVCS